MVVQEAEATLQRAEIVGNVQIWLGGLGMGNAGRFRRFPRICCSPGNSQYQGKFCGLGVK